MYKKLFVLFVVLVLIISLSYLYVYDKKELEKYSENNSIIESDKEIVKENFVLEEVTQDLIENVNYKEQNEETTEDDEILGTLIIEKINLVGEIKEGSSDEILEEYIGHIESTSQYDGNVGLAAHNRGNGYSYFERLNELNIGDEIIYKTKYGERMYIVNNKIEILDTNWTVLENTEENKLTLITCINNRVNQRLCIQAIERN